MSLLVPIIALFLGNPVPHAAPPRRAGWVECPAQRVNAGPKRMFVWSSSRSENAILLRKRPPIGSCGLAPLGVVDLGLPTAAGRGVTAFVPPEPEHQDLAMRAPSDRQRVTPPQGARIDVHASIVQVRGALARQRACDVGVESVNIVMRISPAVPTASPTPATGRPFVAGLRPGVTPIIEVTS